MVGHAGRRLGGVAVIKAEMAIADVAGCMGRCVRRNADMPCEQSQQDGKANVSARACHVVFDLWIRTGFGTGLV